MFTLRIRMCNVCLHTYAVCEWLSGGRAQSSMPIKISRHFNSDDTNSAATYEKMSLTINVHSQRSYS